MEELTSRINSFTTGIGLLVLLHSIIEWYSFFEFLQSRAEFCNALLAEECEYPGWPRMFISVIIQTIIGVALISFDLQDLNSNTFQEEVAYYEPVDEDQNEEIDGKKKRCKFWGKEGRCKKYHAYASYCDEHRDYLENQKIGDLK